MKTEFTSLGAVVVAAGTSRRMGGVNKLFASVRGKPVVAWSVDTCERCSLVQQIALVLNDSDLARGQGLKERRGWSKVTLCSGGARRQDSVKAGLEQVHNCKLVMIHDGARPFLTLDMIDRGLEAARNVGAAIAAVPIKDTVKVVANGQLVRETLPRERLWAAQTPQIFRFDMIARAYENLVAEITDDAAAVELSGNTVQLYMGDYRNIKVTTVQDLAVARVIARSM